ncbi:pirin family protein [Oxalicibacterium faecigallinarum]|uniref:Quercetin 2,3-dioxygenase n=1 Tax=Oxalicibacterium faecigallinarum TaxID=573741 RepID=A0A8J3F3C4_9BURK|nr:pirin family protein [Oxalicibacterium faecigallinarum]GGI19080.1 quercetin 2,3-dioxygenase [Oxalicibacterium faecigallinarum]
MRADALTARTVQDVFPAIRDDIADLHTWRALPTEHVWMVDPFLFLNHHGRQVYPRNNRGLPFGPHPHRGFETVTFILEGDIAHRDSGGHESVIGAGGVQWMTAGSGLIHSETSSDVFKKNGGPMEILQLWVNLPARLKMTQPAYRGLQQEDIPQIADAGGALVHLVSGEWNGHRGPFTPLLDIVSMWFTLSAGQQFSLSIASQRAVFFYVIHGSVVVNGRTVDARHLATFADDGEQLHISASADAVILLCHAEPLDEPVVSHGPFVMNTHDEIRQAIADYQAGKFDG